ncbi:keratinocyte differentiation-associated protein [Tamandua tetradactyla]|uniref:keratinocyte differentiation-associated protein n=1 Tax=Tamandua tetradactyla TaxID=48850 RepID=UPI004053D617
MQIPVLPAVVLLSLLALHSAQGASLGSPEEETTIDNYAAGPEGSNTEFLNIDKLKSVFNADTFLNRHALIESIKRKLPFLNWDAFPKVKEWSAAPDAQ